MAQEQKKTKMTDEERLALAEKLDRELDEFIDGLERKPYTEGWPEDRWQEEMEKHPFFMTKPPEPGQELHPLLEGIQQLKYDPEENTAEDLAESYKEDGNFNFKHKKYRLAILSYTEAIKQKFDNAELKASLHNNRGASNYFLKNYRSALRDCEIALKLKPNYPKVVMRAANCCYEISQYDKCIEHCDTLLQTDPENAEVLTLRQKAINTKKNKERDERKKEIAEKKKKAEEEKLIKEIISRGITLKDVSKGHFKLENLEPKFPELANHRVYVDDRGKLIWPVTLLYPENKSIDFIQEFSEDDTFEDHLSIVFEENPSWDLEKKYSKDNLNIYFERNINLHKIDMRSTLGKILQKKEYEVKGGTPTFIILAKDSSAEKQFISNYKIV